MTEGFDQIRKVIESFRFIMSRKITFFSITIYGSFCRFEITYHEIYYNFILCMCVFPKTRHSVQAIKALTFSLVLSISLYVSVKFMVEIPRLIDRNQTIETLIDTDYGSSLIGDSQIIACD